ncbi:zinc ribbon domain-containing protein [Mycobacterium sp.]|uniref:zinc ribbon domain-containing protein n=1 Tax=Mycobacterium sp. TaxID=1785 RepID=UPI003BAA3555
MVRAPKPKPDPDQPGRFLPNGKAAKAGLNRGIYASCWGLITQRLEDKTSASGTALVYVPAVFSSLQCRTCGHSAQGKPQEPSGIPVRHMWHQDHADVHAANTILAWATQPALTSGPEATPTDAGVLPQARRPNDAQTA